MRLKIYLEIDVMKNRGFDFGDFEITKREAEYKERKEAAKARMGATDGSK